jgi:1,2-phenylacetyl-CoA epoxidase PaaB subunit
MSNKDNAAGIPAAYLNNVSIRDAAYSDNLKALLKNKPVGVALPKDTKQEPIIFFNLKELLSIKEDDYDIKYTSSPEEAVEEIFENKPYQNLIKTHNCHFNLDKGFIQFQKLKVPLFVKYETTVDEVLKVSRHYPKFKPYNRSRFIKNFKIHDSDNTDILIKKDLVYNNRSNIVSVNPVKKKQILKRRSEEIKSRKLQNIIIENTSLYKVNRRYIDDVLKSPLTLIRYKNFIEWDRLISNNLNTIFLSKRKNYVLLNYLKSYIGPLEEFINLFDITKLQPEYKRLFKILIAYSKRIKKYINE